MKYELLRLGPDNFEHMIQSLIQGIAGLSTVIFGAGPDGQREAVIENASFSVCSGEATHGRTIVQAKYKGPDTKQGDWEWLRDSLKKELEGFREKVESHPELIPETYLFFTNIVLTPVLVKGIRDKADAFVTRYRDVIPDIRIYGADDIRTMLENNRDVARCYSGFIMPGDVLDEMQNILTEIGNAKFEDLIEYARQMFREDGAVRLEQAGSVSSRTINLRNVYTDLEAKAQGPSGQEIPQFARYIISLGDRLQKRATAESGISREDFPKHRDKEPEYNMVLIANAGQGKSTLCQYICQIYRAALLQRFKHNEPDVSCYFKGEDASEVVVPCCERFPIQINLRSFAAWINKQSAEENSSVLSYILFLINSKAKAQLSIPDLRSLLSVYPWIFLFDGLDEVPASSNRSEVLRQIQVFLDNDLIESCCDSLVVCTSRPQGYDAAFSPERYRHFELRNMSKPLCERYIEKLLMYIEDNSDARDHYRAILHNALNDQMVSKLMTTPLYTAIIVLLVKMGGSPPTKRYELFHEYCSVVIKREQQKEMLPDLYDGFDWIHDLHAQLGFLLQTESESAENAAAELSTVRCKDIIEHFLQVENYEGVLREKVEVLYTAITKRLSFLSEVSGANQEDCVVFPLRSIQEYFAAEWLITFNDENKLSDALEQISVSAYWRNVYLFTAGYFTKHRDRKNINETFFRICQRNNGDENHEWVNSKICQVTLQGSWLALDLLCDNLFSRPNDQQRYLRVAARLIDADYDGIDLRKKLSQLPDKIAEALLLNHILPHIRETNRINESQFTFLWELASRGNKIALNNLETLCDTEFSINSGAVDIILELGAKHVGDKALSALFHWITVDFFEDFCYPYFRHEAYDSFLMLYIARTAQKDIPLLALRQLVYRYFLMAEFDEADSGILNKLATQNTLLQSMLTDKELQDCFCTNENSGKELSCLSINRDFGNPCFARYESEFTEAKLPELAAMMAFLYAPSHERLICLLKAYADLPEQCKHVFSTLFKSRNWFLQLLSDRLDEKASADELIAHYDNSAFADCLSSDAHYIELATKKDYCTITRSNSWRYFSHRHVILPRDILRSVLEAAKETSIDEPFLSALCYSTREGSEFTPELIEFCIQHFHDLFKFRYGAGIALKAFAYVQKAYLVSGTLAYPEELSVRLTYTYLGNSLIKEILKRIDTIAELGGEYLQVYSLIPCLLPYLRRSTQLHQFAGAAISRFAETQITGNQTALLGCALCMLAGPITEEQRENIQRCFTGPHEDTLIYRIWSDMIELASTEGRLLIHEMLCNYPEAEEYADLICRYVFSIREDLESHPVDRKCLTTLAENAHCDRSNP